MKLDTCILPFFFRILNPPAARQSGLHFRNADDDATVRKMKQVRGTRDAWILVFGVHIVFQMILERSQHDIPAQISTLSSKNRPHRSLDTKEDLQSYEYEAAAGRILVVAADTK
ncbi:hypothetical protein V1477_002393 [Vespula maculifrons]|uniref:Uncharacterized protein n=1 Tax=Vespula maculifrons TaxID=7453 RepID=A0ABD2CWD3_VESMC